MKFMNFVPHVSRTAYALSFEKSGHLTRDIVRFVYLMRLDLVVHGVKEVLCSSWNYVILEFKALLGLSTWRFERRGCGGSQKGCDQWWEPWEYLHSYKLYSLLRKTSSDWGMENCALAWLAWSQEEEAIRWYSIDLRMVWDYQSYSDVCRPLVRYWCRSDVSRLWPKGRQETVVRMWYVKWCFYWQMKSHLHIYYIYIHTIETREQNEQTTELRMSSTGMLRTGCFLVWFWNFIRNWIIHLVITTRHNTSQHVTTRKPWMCQVWYDPVSTIYSCGDRVFLGFCSYLTDSAGTLLADTHSPYHEKIWSLSSHYWNQ